MCVRDQRLLTIGSHLMPPPPGSCLAKIVEHSDLVCRNSPLLREFVTGVSRGMLAILSGELRDQG